MNIIEFHIKDSQGRVVRVGSCSEETLQAQAGPGETAYAGAEPLSTPGPWYDETNYFNNRMKEYPAVGDQLDSVFKMAKALQESGVVLPPDVLGWIQACQAVKDKYPKE
jgi:hypothetical protein